MAGAKEELFEEILVKNLNRQVMPTIVTEVGHFKYD